MKKIMMFLAAALMVLVMGCASAGSQAQSAKSSDGAGKPAAPAAAQKKTAVVYFSATGNTRRLAETAARALKADLIEIKPAQPYTEADLDYTSSGSRVSKEHAAGNARPAVAEQADLSGCQSVVVAYPMWSILLLKKQICPGRISVPSARLLPVRSGRVVKMWPKLPAAGMSVVSVSVLMRRKLKSGDSSPESSEDS